MAEYPAQFASFAEVNSCGGGIVLSFGFDAALVRLENQSAGRAYLNFQGTTASSCGPSLRGCSNDIFGGIPVSGLGLWASATSSGGNVNVSVLALGPWPDYRSGG